MAYCIDLTGKTFGRWTVIKIYRADAGRPKWLCRCECGTEKLVSGGSLRQGTSKSCGCLQIDSVTTHASSYTITFKSWMNMRQRCSGNHPRYAGRGIKVCDRWQVFENFLADMGERPSREHSIDRFPDPNGNYEPGNCRWATTPQQCDNKDFVKKYTHEGMTMNLKEWAKHFDIPFERLRGRIFKCGWTFERAISEDKKSTLYTFEGVSLTCAEWAKISGVPRTLLKQRLGNGMSIERAMSMEKQEDKKLVYNGEAKTITEWEKHLGFNPGIIHSRICQGWSTEEALFTKSGERRAKKPKK